VSEGYEDALASARSQRDAATKEADLIRKSLAAERAQHDNQLIMLREELEKALTATTFERAPFVAILDALHAVRVIGHRPWVDSVTCAICGAGCCSRWSRLCTSCRELEDAKIAVAVEARAAILSKLLEEAKGHLMHEKFVFRRRIDRAEAALAGSCLRSSGASVTCLCWLEKPIKERPPGLVTDGPCVICTARMALDTRYPV
jgi:hypothetical protein